MKNRNIFLSVTLIIVVSAYFFGLSFSIPELNAVAIIITFIAFVFLPICCSNFQPKWFFNLIRVAGWFFGTIVIIIVIFSRLDTKYVDHVSNSVYCTESMYGFVGTDSGKEYCAYNRYGLIDKKIGCYQSSDIYPSLKDTLGIINLCSRHTKSKTVEKLHIYKSGLKIDIRENLLLPRSGN